jgi:YVTN family beta-propeller protein
VKTFRTTAFEQVATIAVGALPHGTWPSGDGSRVYVGIENGDAVTAIDTATNRVIATIPNGQAAQALVYVPGAAPTEAAGVEVCSRSPRRRCSAPHALLHPAVPFPRTFHCSTKAHGYRKLPSLVSNRASPTCSSWLRTLMERDRSTLAQFMTNPAGAQVVNAVGRSARS